MAMPLQLAFFFFTFITLAVTHIFASEFFLYWRYMWFDIPMHMLGGVTIAFGVSILPYIGIPVFKGRSPLMATILSVIGIAVAWEIFEAAAGISIREPGFTGDTVLDLVMGVMGGFVGYGIVSQIRKI